jgi:hypothetical protein
MSGEVIKEFNDQIGELKNKLYDDIIRNNPSDQPGSLDALRRYEQLLKKIFSYWQTLYNVGGSIGYSLRMPSTELQNLFHEKTSWFVQNIVKNPDMDVRIHGISTVERNCEKDPYDLKAE